MDRRRPLSAKTQKECQAKLLAAIPLVRNSIVPTIGHLRLGALILLQAASLAPGGSRGVAVLVQEVRRDTRRVLATPPPPYDVQRDRSSGLRVPTRYVARQLDGALHLVRPKSKAATRGSQGFSAAVALRPLANAGWLSTSASTRPSTQGALTQGALMLDALRCICQLAVAAEAALADSAARREQVEQVRRRAHAAGWLLDREAEQDHFAERIRAALGGAS